MIESKMKNHNKLTGQLGSDKISSPDKLLHIIDLCINKLVQIEDFRTQIS